MWLLLVLLGAIDIKAQVFVDSSHGILPSSRSSDIKTLNHAIEDVRNKLDRNFAKMNERILSIESCLQTLCADPVAAPKKINIGTGVIPLTLLAAPNQLNVGTGVTPLTLLLDRGFTPGFFITVSGKIHDDAHSFEINLQSSRTPDDNIPLHFNPRFFESNTVMNNMREGSWISEERRPLGDLVTGRHCKISIVCDNEDFKISINDKFYCSFKHRMEVEIISYLKIGGAITIDSVTYNNGAVATKKPEVLTCEEGWMMYHNVCMMISDDKVAFDEAELLCASLGGHLAKIEDTLHWAFVRQHLSDSAWIGLTDYHEEGIYRWSNDDSVSTFYRWADGEPNNADGNEDCINLFKGKSYNFNDEGCGNPHHYICEKAATYQKVRCPKNTEYSAGFCYHVSDIMGDWQRGISYCKQQGLSYAKIITKEQWQAVAARAKRFKPIWIGLNDREKEGTFVWQSDDSQAFTNWCSEEPTNGLEAEHCVSYKSAKGYCWNDWQCTKVIKYLCETKQEDGECPDRFIQFQDSCYFISEKKASWYQAKEECGAIGAFLAKMSTPEENHFIRERLTEDTWFGLSDLDKEGEFKWTKDDESIIGDIWARNEPNGQSSDEDCVYLYQEFNYKLNDAPCGMQAYFACTSQPMTS